VSYTHDEAREGARSSGRPTRARRSCDAGVREVVLTGGGMWPEDEEDDTMIINMVRATDHARRVTASDRSRAPKKAAGASAVTVLRPMLMIMVSSSSSPATSRAGEHDLAARAVAALRALVRSAARAAPLRPGLVVRVAHDSLRFSCRSQARSRLVLARSTSSSGWGSPLNVTGTRADG